MTPTENSSSLPGPEELPRLWLGSAAFGADYGLQKGLSRAEAESLLEAAWSAGVLGVDTAPGYGPAEAMLGDLLSRVPRARFRVSTKVRKLRRDEPDFGRAVRDSAAESLAALRRPSLDVLMLHQTEPWALSARAVWDAARALLREGRIAAFGASVYEPGEAEACFEVDGIPLVLQVPFSAFDRRFAPTALEAARRGIRVVARSVFLRGMATAAAGILPAALAPLGRAREAVRLAAETRGFTLDEALFLYAYTQPGVSAVVFGAETPEHVVRNTSAARRAEEFSPLRAEIDKIAPPPRSATDPRLW